MQVHSHSLILLRFMMRMVILLVLIYLKLVMDMVNQIQQKLVIYLIRIYLIFLKSLMFTIDGVIMRQMTKFQEEQIIITINHNLYKIKKVEFNSTFFII
jgi:hypothetical protein